MLKLRTIWPFFRLDVTLTDPFAQTLRDQVGRVSSTTGEQNDKFIATVTSHHVDRSDN